MSAARLQTAVAEWLRKAINERGLEILDGQVTVETYREARAYRRALTDVLAALPGIAKKVDDA